MKYCTPEMSVSATITATAGTSTHGAHDRWPWGHMRMMMQTIWLVVLALPSGLAGMETPWSMPTTRRALTANSRAMITIATQAGSLPSPTRAIRAAEMRSLSASGSRNCPSVVIWPRERAT